MTQSTVVRVVTCDATKIPHNETESCEHPKESK